MSQKDTNYLLYMMKKRRPFFNNTVRPAFAKRHDSFLDEGDENLQMSENKIYIGLNDADTKQQEFETEEYVNILKEVCRNYKVAFSMDIEEGGYYHEDGEYTEETSLVLSLVDIDPEIVRAIAKELCGRFHQESVLITENRINGWFVSSEGNEAEL